MDGIHSNGNHQEQEWHFYRQLVYTLVFPCLILNYHYLPLSTWTRRSVRPVVDIWGRLEKLAMTLLTKVSKSLSQAASSNRKYCIFFLTMLWNVLSVSHLRRQFSFTAGEWLHGASMQSTIVITKLLRRVLAPGCPTREHSVTHKSNPVLSCTSSLPQVALKRKEKIKKERFSL